jgi:UDP-N-acetylmuramate: L-alanyl-gamma-D-glutamyl-meso-diaminopimelate ligase
MVPLAALLIERGHRVTGSDGPLYPPMSTTLERLGVTVARGFAAEHVPADCDVVVVGNAALSDNVEAAEAKRRGLPSSPCHRRCDATCCRARARS